MLLFSLESSPVAIAVTLRYFLGLRAACRALVSDRYKDV